jgi:SSS family transporter
MTHYDYAVLIFYFVFMVAISWVFRRFVTNVSDYFRGGGKALWWMVGGSAFMVQFSAWTFTGAASKAYSDGWPIAVIYLGNVFGFLLNALHFAPRFRQLRVVTGVEAIRNRFGRVSEQFFTWTQLPFGLLQAGIWLNSLAVFFSAVFGIDITLTICATGTVVLVMALIGGSWAVLASDFIQVLVLMPVCLAVTVLAILKVGGISSFLDHAPAGHLDLSQLTSTNFLGLWCVAMILKQLHTTNNLADANRYLCVKDSRHARWAGFLGAALFIVGIVIWFVPPIAASIRFPDLQTMFPQLKNPEEAAFIAIARDVMPVGMMGLLVSGIFAATMSSMDSGLNKNTGFFIKNFYQPVLRPASGDKHLLLVGKLTTIVFGTLIILVALKMSQLNNLSLFQLTQRLSILIGIPIIVPLFLGLIVKNTPPWSAWSTVIVGFVSSLFITEKLTPEWAAGYFHLASPLDAAGREYWRQAIELFGNVAVCSAWFVGTKLFWTRTSAAEKSRVLEFFARLGTPVDHAREEGAASANDSRQESVVGWLCLGYGGFIMLLALIPNAGLGRIAFIGCGGIVAVIGGLLLAASRKPAS